MMLQLARLPLSAGPQPADAVFVERTTEIIGQMMQNIKPRER
jgi:hypothetical protein